MKKLLLWLEDRNPYPLFMFILSCFVGGLTLRSLHKETMVILERSVDCMNWIPVTRVTPPQEMPARFFDGDRTGERAFYRVTIKPL